MSRPDLVRDPEGWERSWQVEIDRCLSKLPTMSLFSVMNGSSARMMMTEDGYQGLALAHKRLVDLQNDLQTNLLRKSSEDDFQSKWKKAGAATRKTHYFTAMERICPLPDMEPQRGHCPEVSWRSFEAGDGQGYLDLLLLICRERPPSQYTYPHHPIMDAFYRLPNPWNTSETYTPDSQLFLQRTFVQQRTTFLSLVVLNVFLSFYGVSEDYTIVKPRQSASSRQTARANAKEMFGKSNAHVIKNAAREDREIRKSVGKEGCAACGKQESSVAQGSPSTAEKFKVCAKCNWIGRTVRYCSRECQTSDWRNGTPPHKLVCAKSASEIAQSAPVSSPPNTPNMPPASPGYTRSPALMHLISLLTESPRMDYVFVRPFPQTDQGVQLGQSVSSAVYAAMRDKAFRDGDPRAVQMMWKFLLGLAEAAEGFGKEALRSQMTKEFGFDPESVPCPPSEEVEEIVRAYAES